MRQTKYMVLHFLVKGILNMVYIYIYLGENITSVSSERCRDLNSLIVAAISDMGSFA